MAVETPSCEVGWRAPEFALADAEGGVHTLASIAGPRGTLVAFICNHCPYVQAIVGRFVRDAGELQQRGVGVIAVMPNDYLRYPDDAPAMMRAFAVRHGFTFPYVVDETQATARAYGAVCTPDFFGFDAGLGLQYRGRLDASRLTPVEGPRELFEAMCRIAETGRGPDRQHASMGCSIKWREVD